MVNTQSVDGAFLHQAKNRGMPRFEYLWILDLDGHQFIDIKEASVIDFLRRSPPISQTVSLRSQQRIQAVERPAHPFQPIEEPQRLVKRSLEGPGLTIELPKLILELTN